MVLIHPNSLAGKFFRIAEDDREAYEAVKKGNIFVAYMAEWCSDCLATVHSLNSEKLQIALKKKNAQALYIDIEKLTDFSAGYNVNYYPTFQLFKQGKLVKELKVARPSASELIALVSLF